MSPLRILAALADRRSFLTFCLVSPGKPRQHPFIFVGLFLSLRPERVPNLSPTTRGPLLPSKSLQFGAGRQTRPQRIPLPMCSQLRPALARRHIDLAS